MQCVVVLPHPMGGVATIRSERREYGLDKESAIRR